MPDILALRLLRRHEVWVVLASLVVVNALFVAAIAAHLLPQGLYQFGRFALLGAVLASLVLAARGLPAMLALLRPLMVWRRPPGWFLFVLLWAPANCVLLLLVKGLHDGTGLAEVTTTFAVISRPAVLVIVLVGSIIGEIVWISYAVGRLSDRFTAFAAGLIVGGFWTLWWVPMVLLGIGVVPGLPLGALLINQTALALMCAFVYSHTRSGLLVLIMQVVFNLSVLTFPVSPGTGGVSTYWAFAILYFATALAVHFWCGPRPLLLRPPTPVSPLPA